MKKIKRILSFVAATAVTATLISGCDIKKSSESSQKAEIVKKSVFYMYDKDSNDVFTLNDTNEKEKITSDIQNIKYSDELKSYILSDKDNGLYLLDKDGNKDKVSSDVDFNKVQTESDGNIYFLTTGSDLYMKGKDSEKEKIASNVTDYYEFSGNIIYKDTDQSLFLKKSGAEKLKIASSVSDFRISSHDAEYCAYINDNNLYLKNIKTDEKEKITEKNNGAPFEFADTDTIVYFEDYNAESQKGELYMKKYGGDKKKIASDITSIQVYKDGVFYIDSDKAMHFKKYDDETKNKILDDAEEMIASSDGNMFVCDKDKNIYKITNGSEKEKIVQDVESYRKCKNNIVALDKEKNLYFGNTKIGSDVKVYSVNENDVAYINKSNEIYLSKNGGEPQKVISDAKEYRQIEFNDEVLFVNTLSADDIKGCWKIENAQTKEKVYFEFDNEQKMSMFGFDQYEMTEYYTVESADNDKITLQFDGEKMVINRNSGDSFSVSFNADGSQSIPFQKITEDEYNKMKNITNTVYKVAIQEFGAELVFFEGIKNVNGTDYYVYNTDEGDSGTSIYIDENGAKNVMRNGALVPYGTNTVSNTASNSTGGQAFSKDMALQYAKDYCQKTYNDVEGIQISIGETSYENGKTYYKVKLASKAAIAQGGTGTMGWIKVFEDGTVYSD